MTTPTDDAPTFAWAHFDDDGELAYVTDTDDDGPDRCFAFEAEGGGYVDEDGWWIDLDDYDFVDPDDLD
ncbi:MAG: hypothetical protein AAFY08_15695 [Planctomycetota bacterium]